MIAPSLPEEYSPDYRSTHCTHCSALSWRRDANFSVFLDGADHNGSKPASLPTLFSATLHLAKDKFACVPIVSSIIEEIEEAARRTTGGVFLFTRDDSLAGEGDQAAPGDNVVFEAGFFAHSKSRGRVLIIRETGAKMPADLGGSIYAVLADKTNIAPLETRLKRFLKTSL